MACIECQNLSSRLLDANVDCANVESELQSFSRRWRLGMRLFMDFDRLQARCERTWAAREDARSRLASHRAQRHGPEMRATFHYAALYIWR